MCALPSHARIMKEVYNFAGKPFWCSLLIIKRTWYLSPYKGPSVILGI